MKNFGFKDKIEVDNTNKNFNGGDLTPEQSAAIAERLHRPSIV